MKDIFLTILEISVTTSIVILLVALLSELIDKKFTSKWKYWVWLLIAIRLIIPFNPDFEAAPAKIEVAVPDRVISTALQQENDLSTDYMPVVNEPSTETAEREKELSLLDVVSMAWISGAVIFFGWNVAVYLGFRKRTLSAGTPADERMKEALSAVKAELGISKNIDTIVCKNITSPMIMGFLSPKLILPKRDYDDTELYFILRHELTHYNRRDTLYKALLLLANAVHWFNPVVWIMRKLAGTDLELSCDAAVIDGRDMDTRRQYSETILASVHRENVACGVFSTHFYGGAKTLKKRFTNIFNTEKRKKGTAAFVSVLLAGILLGGAVACSAENGLPAEEEVTRLIMKAQSVYQPGDDEVLDTISYENFIDGIYYDEIGNFDEAVAEIFTEKGIEQLRNTVERVNGKPVFLEQEGRTYRYSPMAESDAIKYYSVIHSVSLIEQGENNFVYEIKHSSEDVQGNTEEYTSYITIAEENGKYLVESFDSKRFAISANEATGESEIEENSSVPEEPDEQEMTVEEIGYMTLEEITAEGYYPLWMQPNTNIVYDENGVPEITQGGELTPDDLIGRDDIASIGFISKTEDMTMRPETKAEYDLHGFIQNIYFLWPDGSYNLSPYYDIRSAEITYYADIDEFEQEKGKTVVMDEYQRNTIFWLSYSMVSPPPKSTSEPMGFPRYKITFNNNGTDHCIYVDSQNIFTSTLLEGGNYKSIINMEYFSQVEALFNEAQ